MLPQGVGTTEASRATLSQRASWTRGGGQEEAGKALEGRDLGSWEEALGGGPTGVLRKGRGAGSRQGCWGAPAAHSSLARSSKGGWELDGWGTPPHCSHGPCLPILCRPPAHSLLLQCFYFFKS